MRIREFQGASFERQGLNDALNATRRGQILVVWKLDRLGRSLGDLIHIIDNLGKAGFVSLSESIDTTTAGGKLVFHMMGALAEFERSLIAERAKAGMSAARKRGVSFGRPKKLTKTQIDHAQEMVESGRQPLASMAHLYGVNNSTPRQFFLDILYDISYK